MTGPQRPRNGLATGPAMGPATAASGCPAREAALR
ncbi:hypothetical protein FEP63_04690 [Burkholderia multivorans]|nr:hypothetical protein [Burkholderia multivorans]MDR8879224.1 hypothetical protein [Burkholderia multivorans]MDR8889013.1 hypothetical protein [Burkholderia multivorans]MDR8891692.1 hypothetical protein [Burkholderia multivorans]MDR8898318.1 hypothetical protein [Burkholderia multivorans]